MALDAALTASSETLATAFCSTSVARSSSRHRLRNGWLHRYFGATNKVPERVLQWYDNGRARPLTVAQNGSQLKHLENIYEKLGVRSRTAALAKLRAVAVSHG